VGGRVSEGEVAEGERGKTMRGRVGRVAGVPSRDDEVATGGLHGGFVQLSGSWGLTRSSGSGSQNTN